MQQQASSYLHWIDIVIIVVYFVGVFSVGFYFVLKPCLIRLWQRISKRPSPSNSQQSQSETENFFLANKDVTFFAIGCSLFASNIGSEHFIGLASSGAVDGISVSWGEWLSPFCIMMLAWLFVPFYLKTRVITLPEFIEKRYNRYCRFYLTILSLLMYILTKISVSLYAGNVVIKELLQINNEFWSFFILIVSTSVYTILGGLNAVIYTEVLQTFVLILGGALVFILGMVQVNGWSGLYQRLAVDLGREDMFHLFQPVNHPHFPWTGVVFGQMFGGALWYWCTDQSIVQRALSAKSLNHARGGCLMAGFLKLLPPFLMVIPGMMSKALYTDEVTKSPNRAFVILVSRILPIGCRGLMIAAMLAALMSSLASVFHSSSTLFTMDIYVLLRQKVVECIERRRRRGESAMPIVQQAEEEEQSEPQITPTSDVVRENQSENEDIDRPRPQTEAAKDIKKHDTEYVLVGRLAGILITILGIIWIPIVPRLSQELYIYTHKIMSYFAPSISMVFLWGVLSPRVNGVGAFITLILGLIVGGSRLILEIVYASTNVKDMNIVLGFFVKMNFLHFSACFILLSTISIFVFSLISKKPDPEVVKHLTVQLLFNRKTTSETTSITAATEEDIGSSPMAQSPTVSAEEQVAVDEKEYAAERKTSGYKVRLVSNVAATVALAMSLFSLFIILR